MDAPRDGSPAAAAVNSAEDLLNSIIDDSIKDASLVEIPSEAKEIDYPAVDAKNEEEKVKEEEGKVKEEEVKEDEEEKKEESEEEQLEEEIPKEPTPTPVTPASPTIRTIPVQKSEEEEEEEEEEEIVEKSRPLVIRQTTSEEKEEEQPSTPKKVESVKSNSIRGFEEVSRDDLVEATKEEAEKISRSVVEEKKEEEPVAPAANAPAVVSSTINGQPVPRVVVLTKADSSSSPFVDFINEHPQLVRQMVVAGVVGAACGVAYMVMRKHR